MVQRMRPGKQTVPKGFLAHYRVSTFLWQLGWPGENINPDQGELLCIPKTVDATDPAIKEAIEKATCSNACDRIDRLLPFGSYLVFPGGQVESGTREGLSVEAQILRQRTFSLPKRYISNGSIDSEVDTFFRALLRWGGCFDAGGGGESDHMY